MRETDALKTCQKSKLLRKKIWINAVALRSIYIRETVYFCIIIFSCISSIKAYLRFLLDCFLEKCFSKYLGEKLRFQKTETLFCRRKSTDNNDIKIFLSLENPCTCLLAKEKTWKHMFNLNSELSQNRTEKQIMRFKTTVY